MGKSDLRKRSLKLLKLITVNLLLLFVFLELASVAGYYFKTREFFYTRNKDRVNGRLAELESELRETRDGSTPLFRLHPYFGYVRRRGESAYPTNNFGFHSSFDFPFRKTNKDQYIIGIFGGSVAARLALFENRFLVKALKESPYFQNKEIVVLCFAIAAYKQPQQLLILNYFLSIGQPLDMVVNIDGFNETAVSNLDRKAGLHISMPAASHVQPLIDLANNDLAGPALTLSLQILELKKQLRDTVAKLAACKLATCYALRWMQMEYLSRSFARQSAALGNLEKVEQRDDALIYLNKAETTTDESEAYDQMADLWADSSLMMKEILSAKGIPYFHFLQPNQYYSTSRRFSEQEKEIAISETSIYADAVRKGYSRLLPKVSSLQHSGVRVFNAVNIFDDVGGVVYNDDCCHYNKRGNEIFVSYMVQNILKSLNNQPQLTSATSTSQK